MTIGFLRIRTNNKIFKNGASLADALDRVHEWFDSPLVVPLQPTERHLQILDQLLRKTGKGGDLVRDAHLAALALEHDATIHTADRDFARFPSVKWANPLQP